MAASPGWKVYLDKEYRAACKYIEDAAALVAMLGDGATIRGGHSTAAIFWTEGKEDQSAAESYDHVASVVEARSKALYEKCMREREIANQKYRDAGSPTIGDLIKSRIS